MPIPSLVFFGSFLHYSALVLESLLTDPRFTVTAVVTTPPHPQGRHRVLTKNPVHQLAEQHRVPVFTPEKLDDQARQELVTLAHGEPDLFVTAGYGKLLPPTWLQTPRLSALNVHLSLLPKFRGANPLEWALLLGESQSGVTVIEMSPEFDTGQMIAQAPLDLAAAETRESGYQKLYQLGAEISPPVLARYCTEKNGEHGENSPNSRITYFSPPQLQPDSPTPYARRLNREDGFVSWRAVQQTLAGQTFEHQELGPGLQEAAQWLWPNQAVPPLFLERASRALSGFPGLWTRVTTAKGEKRLKLLSVSVESKSNAEAAALRIKTAQLEGQAPAAWPQLKTAVV